MEVPNQMQSNVTEQLSLKLLFASFHFLVYNSIDCYYGNIKEIEAVEKKLENGMTTLRT